MAKLEDIKVDAKVKGIIPNAIVTILNTKWYGQDSIEVVYKDDSGNTTSELLMRDKEHELNVINQTKRWPFDADGIAFKLVSEAFRIKESYLFDPMLAVHSSLIDPLPHQITAVYDIMLKRQPLRFLLADDPGAGKTIMTGLLIKELQARGSLKRCLIVCPGMLAEQWQDELSSKFQLQFDILTNEKDKTSKTGNWLSENDLIIGRLDKLSRDENIQQKLKATNFDLVVCDEAHKMSASRYGNDVKETKRYKLGKLLSAQANHFLLLTATPHNGKEEEFQLFMALLDGDRFEGSYRDGPHVEDARDLMRRMVKEKLVKFDGKPLFPERLANTVTYELSEIEATLYNRVTDYVREQFNLADKLENDGRKGTVGFALTTLQRRLASSPEAIYQSLKRRKERFENRLKGEKLLKSSVNGKLNVKLSNDNELSLIKQYDTDFLDDIDDVTEDELNQAEDTLVDKATTAQTIAELEAEITILARLEKLALETKLSNKDKKWEELSKLLQEDKHMVNADGHREKLVIFTEHRDTLNYLQSKISNLIGRNDAVVVIHGGMGREDRRSKQEVFKYNKDTSVLIATDAAGEGINLQRAHLMINYDLPWNPNRLEQRFGRIHRIGQTEVCHLWNLVAENTRESEVFLRLLKKIEMESKALGGAIFDVLGKTIAGTELRKLLIEAIRYGNDEKTRNYLYQEIDKAFDTNH